MTMTPEEQLRWNALQRASAAAERATEKTEVPVRDILAEMPADKEEKRHMTDKPIVERVRNLLELPDDESLYTGMPLDRRRDAALLLLAQGQHEIRQHGCGLHVGLCGRVKKLENFRIWIFGGVAFLIAAGGILLFALHLAGAFRQVVGH